MYLHTVDREDEYIECLASIMNDISYVIFGGDLNMDLNNKSNLCKQLCSFASDLQLQFVDDKISSTDKCTFSRSNWFVLYYCIILLFLRICIIMFMMLRFMIVV